MDLHQELNNAVGPRGKQLAARIAEVSHDWTCGDTKATGRFLYLRFRDGKPTLREFVEYLVDHITHFSLPVEVRYEALQNAYEEKDERYQNELNRQARDLFARSATSGEPGELILYLLLEGLLKAPQIACKMYLKTSHNMAVHGSDGIHVSFDEANQRLRLYWGESKLYDDVASALKAVCESLNKYEKVTSNGISGRDHDLDIIKKHISVPSKELQGELLKYFDPYFEESNHWEEHFACFVGFDYHQLRDEKLRGRDDLEKHFRDVYTKRVEEICQTFNGHIESHNLRHIKFTFFLIPFESVAKLRELFFARAGIIL